MGIAQPLVDLIGDWEVPPNLGVLAERSSLLFSAQGLGLRAASLLRGVFITLSYCISKFISYLVVTAFAY
jgi:hypothetical protein